MAELKRELEQEMAVHLVHTHYYNRLCYRDWLVFSIRWHKLFREANRPDLMNVVKDGTKKLIVAHRKEMKELIENLNKPIITWEDL